MGVAGDVAREAAREAAQIFGKRGKQFIKAGLVPFKTEFDFLFSKRPGRNPEFPTTHFRDVFESAKDIFRAGAGAKAGKGFEAAWIRALQAENSKYFKDAVVDLGIGWVSGITIGIPLYKFFKGKFLADILTIWNRVEVVIGEIPADIGGAVVLHLALATPYRENGHPNAGRAAAGWGVSASSVGAIEDVKESRAYDKWENARVTAEIAAARLRIIGKEGDENWTISNSVFYIKYLNEGWSPQAEKNFAIKIAREWARTGVTQVESRLANIGSN